MQTTEENECLLLAATCILSLNQFNISNYFNNSDKLSRTSVT